MTGAAEPNPTVDRRELAVYFRDLREQRKRTPDQLASVLEVDRSYASRLDTGARGFRPEDVRKLCTWYGLGTAEEERLVALAVGSSKRAWWQQAKVSDSYRTLIGMERAAVSINEYCSLVPGLLQTRAYAEAAVVASQVSIPLDRARAAADLRIRRQDILDRPQPPELSVVIDEVALARGAGGSGVMRAQLQHLLEMTERPEITIQVIDFETGLYPTGVSQFILLEMRRGLPDIYYADEVLRPRDSSADDALRQGWRLWRTLQGTAMSAQRSADLLMRYRDRLAQ